MMNRTATAPRLETTERTAIGPLPDDEYDSLRRAGWELSGVNARGAETVFTFTRPARPRAGDIENRATDRHHHE